MIYALESLKICLVCSHGGHYAQIMQLVDAFEGHKTFLVTYRSKITQNLKGAFTLRHYGEMFWIIPTLISATVQAIVILSLLRPAAIVSTGSEIAIPFAYIGKLMGIRIIFIESLTRARSKSFTGRIVYPVADLFLVQWSHMASKYGPKALWAGRVL